MKTLRELEQAARQNIQDREQILRGLFQLACHAESLFDMQPIVDSALQLMRHCPVCETRDRAFSTKRTHERLKP